MKVLFAAVIVTALSGQITATPQEPSATLAPHYVNSQNPAEYIDFGPGNRFSGREYGQEIAGTYELTGHKIVLVFPGGEKTTANLKNGQIVDRGKIWVPVDPAAQGGAPVSLAEQLVAQYPVAKVDVDANGCRVTQPGTILASQKDGIYAVPWDDTLFCAGKYQDGKINSPPVLCRTMNGNNFRMLQTGERLYTTSIEFNLKKEQVAVGTVSCTPYPNANGVNAIFKAGLIFQFPKGYLETANVTQVEDVIAQVFSVFQEDARQNQTGGTPGQDQQNPSEQADQTSRASIDKGQTIEEVKTILGAPEKRFNVGAKTIFIYKDVKITFVDGKVADVQ